MFSDAVVVIDRPLINATKAGLAAMARATIDQARAL
jgi:hypothetical protein